ncbi:MAG: S-formylglutathione hydrolase [Alphaproteobacteria bacterium]|nr:S-formylglutathione hydrolase [Alphaproteobacteria bacterium]
MEQVSRSKCFGGSQAVFSHHSKETGTAMRFSVFLPAAAMEGAPRPALIYLSGLTCTEENVTTKAGAQRYCAEHGLILVCPDTSPRGTDFPGEHDAYDFGSGAGFYVDATQEPWSTAYRMESYVTKELIDLVTAEFPIRADRIGITGHSMGGHGALTLALKNPDLFKSVSAFAPIASPLNCPWGEKALTGYLGDDRAAWRAYDSAALIEDGHRVTDILVDQGDADPFLGDQLKPELLMAACEKAGIPLTLRMQPGYDHSYYFIASVIGDHIAWHAERLKD